MTGQSEYLYDVFISYSPADQAWVDEWLLPRLEQANLRVAVDYRDFIIGMPRLENIERALQTSHRTITVLTPEWLTSEWNLFEALWLRSSDPAARQRKMLPVLLKPSPLPDAIDTLEKADLTIEHQWEKQLRRLTRDIEDVIPVPFPGKGGDVVQWRRWLRRYRRELVRRIIGVVGLITVACMLLQIGPFRPQWVWLPKGDIQVSDTHHLQTLYNTGNTLLVGAQNVGNGCNQPDKGIWYLPVVSGDNWQESEVGDSLCLPEWGDSGALSDITAFASPSDITDTVYALTSHSGLLVSNDAGKTFTTYAAGFPELAPNNWAHLLVVNHAQPSLFWVAGETAGLYVYRQEKWTQVDGQAEGGCTGLPALRVTSLWARKEMVLIGTDRQGLWQSRDAGNSCHLIFDSSGRYTFFGLWDISQTHLRYLTLVYDGHVSPNILQLLILCPLPDSCSDGKWAIERTPVWEKVTGMEQVLVQKGADGKYEWFLVTDGGKVWQGGMDSDSAKPLPSITRCFPACEAGFAPAGAGQTPYLLAANRVYTYGEGIWWRRWWP